MGVPGGGTGSSRGRVVAAAASLVLLIQLSCCCASPAAAAATGGGGEQQGAKYKDPRQPLNARVEDLLRRMTLAEKIGQMSQIDQENATAGVISNYFIGASLEILEMHAFNLCWCSSPVTCVTITESRL